MPVPAGGRRQRPALLLPSRPGAAPTTLPTATPWRLFPDPTKVYQGPRGWQDWSLAPSQHLLLYPEQHARGSLSAGETCFSQHVGPRIVYHRVITCVSRAVTTTTIPDSFRLCTRRLPPGSTCPSHSLPRPIKCSSQTRV